MIPKDARELLDQEKGALVRLAQVAVRIGHSGRTHLLTTIAVEGRWRPLVDRIAPPTDWEPLLAAARLADGLPLARLLIPIDDFVYALRAVDGDHPSTATILRDLSRPCTPGRFHGVALHPESGLVGEVMLHAVEKEHRRALH